MIYVCMKIIRETTGVNNKWLILGIETKKPKAKRNENV